MKDRLGTLITMAAAATILATTIGPKPAPWLVWNASASVPIGLYKVTPATHLAVTDLVVALLPPPLAAMLADEGYLPRGVPLIKRVLALPGQTVCRTGVFVTADRILMGPAREKDRNGHPPSRSEHPSEDNEHAWSSALFPAKPERSNHAASPSSIHSPPAENPQPQRKQNVQSSGTNAMSDSLFVTRSSSREP